MKKLFFVLLLFCTPVFAQYYNATCAANPALSPGQCAAVLSSGGTVVLFNGAQPGSGTRSQQFYVAPATSAPANFLAFEFSFSGNPGAFNYQIEDATTDLTGNFTTIPTAGTLTSCPVSEGGSYVCRIEMNPFMGRYGRIYVNTATANAVAVTVTVSR
jgi:hypothetical protein